MLDEIRFEGRLIAPGGTVDLGFGASIDETGALQLVLEAFPFSLEAYNLKGNGRPGQTLEHLTLNGTSASGATFHSDYFILTKWTHRSQVLEYQGEALEAEIVIPTSLQDQQRALRQWFRKFSVFYGITRDSDLGQVHIAGNRVAADSQELTGYATILCPDTYVGEDWETEAARFLEHLARVLSFASDTYLNPRLEERVSPGTKRIRVLQTGRANPPFLQPFHYLSMEPIFGFACDTFFTRPEEIDRLDPAIRWLTAAAQYDESRLMNAMSALENILQDAPQSFLQRGAFGRLASDVRKVLRQHEGTEAMLAKVAELNRRSFREKLEWLIAERGIVTSDMPEGWLATIIAARNTIVHTGLSEVPADDDPDVLDHTIWAREIVTRMVLERLGFVGAYRSWLHQDRQLRFPECTLI